MLQVEKFYTSPVDLEVLEPSDKSSLDFIFKEIFEYQIYNNIPEMKIKNGDVVVDVGAHIGIYSRYAAFLGASRVIAMEMEPRTFSCLKLNVRPEDDIFNCVLFDKVFTRFKLENDLLVIGFTLDYFFEGGLFEKIDFLKINISGKEQTLLNSFSQKLCNVIDKISVKMYNLNDVDKKYTIEHVKSKGFPNVFNIVIPNHNTELLYFWK
jgi:FkbM family methyltransferase